MFIGGFIGKISMYVFGLIGILSPVLFMLERIYKNTFSNSYKDDIKYINKHLNLLRENVIFTEEEFLLAREMFSNINNRNIDNENYYDCLNILVRLKSEKIISEADFNNKVKSLKKTFNQ